MTVRLQRAACSLIVLFAAVSLKPGGSEAAMDGSVALGFTAFPEEAQFSSQRPRGVRPAMSLTLAGSKSLPSNWDLVAGAFSEVDPSASESLRVDVRELYLVHYGASTQFRIGAFTEHWGMLEARNIVDIINSQDIVEDFKGQTKLGQPGMVVSRLWEAGRLDWYLLPYQRGQRLPDGEDRFRVAGLPLTAAEFEAGRWENSTAARFTFNAGGEVDLALSHYYGTSREPVFQALFDVSQPAPVALVPFYRRIQQTAFEAQAVAAGAVWKLESFRRSGDGPDFYGLGAGVEREFPAVWGTHSSFTPYVELYYDSRDPKSSPRTAFDHDLFIGARLALNDLSSTELSMRYLHDLEQGSSLITVKASRRIAKMTVLLEVDALVDTEGDPALESFAQDSRVFLQARYSF